MFAPIPRVGFTPRPALYLSVATQLLGKQADLGSSRFSALYMQQPQALEDQMFPEKVWGSLDAVNVDDLVLVV